MGADSMEMRRCTSCIGAVVCVALTLLSTRVAAEGPPDHHGASRRLFTVPSPAPPNNYKNVPAALAGELAAPYNYRHSNIHMPSTTTDPPLTRGGDSNYYDGTWGDSVAPYDGTPSWGLSRQEHQSYDTSTMGPELGYIACHGRGTGGFPDPELASERVQAQNMFAPPEMFAHNQKVCSSTMCKHTYEHPGVECCQHGSC